MSTPQFTLIAGAMAMPRLRPLELVSRSIGREWSLLPPNISLRKELKVLYTAMMRTFCLNAAAIRAMCRWDPQTLRRQPAAPSAPAVAPIGSAIPLDLRHPARSFKRKNRQWNTIAGGACAISGAAVIAWLVASQQRQPPAPTLAAAPDVTLNARATHVDDDAATSEHRRTGKVARSTDARDTWNRARGDLNARSSGQTAPQTADTPDAPTANAGRFDVGNGAASERAFPVARRAVDTNASASPRHATDRSDTDRFARGASRKHSTKRERDAIINAGTHRAPHPTFRSLDAEPRYSWRSQPDAGRHPTHGTLHRTRPQPSMAGAYSPFAPSPRANSDYASVTMSAGMHGIAPAAIARGHVDTDSTEWMNQISQRRVTEIPDRFSK
ncbi:conserved hypothetical protein [Paraburkholderia piptadeniae]|uniref:Uncharacterized protein n=1 Tax=Paraburkholderia piptadeniae TaxID=1701573 RepID=A0A1N7SNU3_9BURK|nr:hypothetical protein [Paraburkholderia piptadeniae]SIT48601.1 conserved hypothetical protein [Paraburkholderia piptadeniae]